MAFFRRCIPVLKTIPTVSIKISDHNIHRYVSPTLKIMKKREKKQGGKKINPRNQFAEWNLEAELYGFGKRVNENFDSDLLLQAFTDYSYVVKEEMKQKELEFEVKIKDNRSLAKEGQRFMKDYIQVYLETVLPKFPQQGINSVLQYLTSTEILAHVSSHLGTKDIILAAKYPVDTSVLANTLEALVGALLKSSGEERAAHFVRDFIITQLNGQDVNDLWHIEDPWSLLTNLAKNATIEPRLIGEVGKNTLLACYRVGLYVDKRMISSGFGETVAIAKEMAAREALKKIFETEDHMKPINFQLQGIPKPNSQTRYEISAS